MRRVAVLGAGAAGTAMAQVAAENGHAVCLWGIEPSVLTEIRERRANTRYLPGIQLHQGMQPCDSISQVLDGAEIILVCVPTHAVREVAREAAPYLDSDSVVLNVAKGLEEGTDLRMSQVLTQELGHDLGERVASMGGPAIAREFARRVPTAVIVAARQPETRATVQATFQNEYFKVETTTDLVGLELAATLKNVYAIALGMCDCARYGTNTKSFLAILALREMQELVTALGGEARTLYGLAGVGDLITTGFNPHSRNRTLGEKLCSDPNWPEFVRTHTVEGVAACRSAADLAAAAGVKTPLLEVVREALSGGEHPDDALRRFLQRFTYGLEPN